MFILELAKTVAAIRSCVYDAHIDVYKLMCRGTDVKLRYSLKHDIHFKDAGKPVLYVSEPLRVYIG